MLLIKNHEGPIIWVHYNYVSSIPSNLLGNLEALDLSPRLRMASLEAWHLYFHAKVEITRGGLIRLMLNLQVVVISLS